jgi:hypothetical protein
MLIIFIIKFEHFCIKLIDKFIYILFCWFVRSIEALLLLIILYLSKENKYFVTSKRKMEKSTKISLAMLFHFIKTHSIVFLHSILIILIMRMNRKRFIFIIYFDKWTRQEIVSALIQLHLKGSSKRSKYFLLIQQQIKNISNELNNHKKEVQILRSEKDTL